MKVNQLWCAMTGHRESKLPYEYGSYGYKKLKKTIEEQVIDLMHQGATNWIGGLQNGVDEYVSMTVLEQGEKIGTTTYLYLVQPFEGMEKSFSERQLKAFYYLKDNAADVHCLYKQYVDGCYRKRNQILIDKSDFLLAVRKKNALKTGTQMSINIAFKKGIEVRIIDPETYEVEIIPAMNPPKIIIE